MASPFRKTPHAAAVIVQDTATNTVPGVVPNQSQCTQASIGSYESLSESLAFTRYQAEVPQQLQSNVHDEERCPPLHGIIEILYSAHTQSNACRIVENPQDLPFPQASSHAAQFTSETPFRNPFLIPTSHGQSWFSSPPLPLWRQPGRSARLQSE